MQKISIEYCTAWGYLDKAVGLAQNLLRENKNLLSSLKLIPSAGGVFEVKLNEELLFSKKETQRFPSEDEVESLVKEKI